MEREAFQILVVDDEPVTRVRVRSALEEFGYSDVREAADGLEAQAVLEKHPDVDLVITDILMPGLDGIELLQWGREHVPSPEWILLSGVDTFDAAVEAIRVGAFDFLAKPPGTEQLEVSVRNALEQRRLIKERDRLYGELEETNKQLLAKVRQLEDKSELLRRDLERAEIIQRALLPTAPPQIERYCIHALYRPGHYVGGDLYDVKRLDDRNVAFYVADATGHGVTAAMLSVLFKQRFLIVEEDTGKPLSPAVALEKANRALLEAVDAPGLFLTVTYGLLDTSDGHLRLASAGHPPVLYVRADGGSTFIERTGPALGLTADAHYDEASLTLRVDDRLLLYTDGLTDSGMAPERMRELLNDDDADPHELLVRFVGEGQEDAPGANGEDRDDVTLLLLDVHAGPSEFDNGVERGERERRQVATPRSDVVFYGDGKEAAYLTVRGRAIWTHADAVYEAAGGILETGRSLVVDLSECEYMDSTCLGTIHELVTERDVRLQGVRTAVRDLFEELSMEQVLSSIQEKEELPDMHPLAATAEGDTSSPLRILRAHEALAELSTRNREKFQQVVDALRTELEEDREH